MPSHITNELATYRPNNVKILITSRPKQYFQRALKDAFIVHISLESELVGKDISIFVSQRLLKDLPDHSQGPLRDSLQSTIFTRSNGLFLYTRLILDQIIPTIRSARVSEIENLAKALPLGLEHMYNVQQYAFQCCRVT